MAKYKTAKELGILPEERKALIAFVKNPHIGNAIELNGMAHLYDQSDVDAGGQHGCGTMGCIAGYVFHHVTKVQGKRSLRGAKNPNHYIGNATEVLMDGTQYNYSGDPHPPFTFMRSLYSDGGEREIELAKKVVDKALKTGKAKWPSSWSGD